MSGPGGCLVPGAGLGGEVSQHALRQTPPLWTESQTPVKTLPWPNFVAAGNYCVISPFELISQTKHVSLFVYDTYTLDPVTRQQSDLDAF